jgi:hypothetical protein
MGGASGRSTIILAIISVLATRVRRREVDREEGREVDAESSLELLQHDVSLPRRNLSGLKKHERLAEKRQRMLEVCGVNAS